MRWFKHLTCAADDEKLSEILDLYGPEGYGVYWIILEKIAAQMDKSERTSARYSFKKWSSFCKKSPKVFRKFSESFQKLSLFSLEICEKNSDFLIIDCPNLLKFRDEYSKRSRQTPDIDTTDTGQTPDQETEAETEAEKYKEAFSRWWLIYPERNGRKIGKKKAFNNFKKIKKDQWKDLKTATENYSSECNGLPKDAERFLRNDFWKDFLGVANKTDSTEAEKTRLKNIEKNKSNSNSQEGVPMPDSVKKGILK